MEKNAVNNVQYHCHESLEINTIPASTDDDVLERSVCRTLSLTSHEMKPDDLQACHCLKKKDTVIIKFKCRKQRCSILTNRKTSVINQMVSSNLIFLVGSIFFQRACVTRTVNYLINVDSWKMLTRFIPSGFGITLSM